MLLNRVLILFAIAATAILVLAALLVNVANRDHDTSAAEISVRGLVNHEITLTIDDLKSRPNVTITAELVCVSGASMGTHNWTGVRLKDLLSEAGVQDGAIKVAFYSFDNYSTDLNLQDAMRDDIVVAFLEDRLLLTDTRLVVPGKWGYKWITGIESIQVVNFDFLGTWESDGYSDDASVNR